MRLSRFIFLILIAAPALARAHDDIVPYELNGQIVTGGHDDLAGTDTVALRVFGYDFGEDPLDPNIIGDPGLNNGSFGIGVFPNNGLLPAGFTLGIDVLTNLAYWDGIGAVDFEAAADGIFLGLKRGSSTVLIGGDSQSGTVPSIGSTGASGRLHVHLESQLHYTDGLDGALPNAPDGIYLVGLSLKLPGSGLADSDPIYIVYNQNLDEEIHDEALEWVAATLVPEPASWVLMGAGTALFLLTRKRKHSSQ